MKKPLKVLSTAALAGLVGTTAFVSVAQAEQAEVTIKSFVFETAEGKIVVDMDTLIVAITSPTHPVNTLIQEEGQLKLPYGIQDNKERFITLDAFITASTNNLGKTVEEVIELIEDVVSEEEVKTFKKPVVTDGELVLEPVVTPDPDPIPGDKVVVESVSAINKTNTTVKLASAPEAELTEADFTVFANGNSVNVTKVEKVVADTTNKTYKLTHATLDNQEGTLTINGFDTAFDFKAPELTKIEVVGNKTLVVHFNEALGTVAPQNFQLAGIGTMPTVEQAVRSADRKSVTLTLGTANLLPQDYVLVLGKADQTDRVVDRAGNPIYGGTSVSFRPTVAQLTIESAPQFVAAQYDNARGEISVSFTKAIDGLDVTKLKVNDVALTSADLVTGTGNERTITLSTATRTAVNALEGQLSLVASEDAFTDGTTATKGDTVSISKVTPAVVSNAAYNEETNTLTVVFDQPVKIADLSKIKVADRAGVTTAVATGATVDNKVLPAVADQTGKTTWELKLHNDEVAKIQASGVNKDNLKVFLDEGAVQNATDVTPAITNAATTYATGVKVNYTADTTKPYLVGAQFAHLTKAGHTGDADKPTGTITLTFNEKVNVDGVISIGTAANNRVDLTISNTDTNNKNEITISAANLEHADVEALIAQYQSGKTMKVFYAKEIIEDTNGLKNEAVTFANGFPITYKDFVKPATVGLVSAKQDNTNLVLEFDELVSKESAEILANYSITDGTGATLAIQSVQLQNDGKTVLIKTASQTALRPYTLAVRNVTDLQGNIMNNANHTFSGTATVKDDKLETDQVKSSAIAVKNDRDEIVVGFSAPVDQTRALTLSNFRLFEENADDENNLTKPVSLAGATLTLNADQDEVTIKLGANTHLQTGKDYRVSVQNVTDIYGNVLDSDATDVEVTVSGNDSLAAPTAIAHVRADGKSVIELTFDQAVNRSAAENKTNYVVAGVTNQSNIVNAVYTYDAKEKEGKVVLTLADGVTLGSTVTVQLDANIKNLNGSSVPVISRTLNVPVADLLAPKFATEDPIVATANTGSTEDTIVLSFTKDIVDNATARDERNYKVSVNGTVLPISKNVADIDDTTATAPYWVSDITGDTVTISIDPEFVNLVAGDTVSVTASQLRDEAGNRLAEETVSTTVEAAADAFEGVTTIDFDGNRTVTLTFDGNLLESSIDVTDFNIVGSNFVNAVELDSADATKVILTLAAPVTTSTITVKASSSFNIKDDMGNALNGTVLFTEGGIDFDFASLVLNSVEAAVSNVLLSNGRSSISGEGVEVTVDSDSELVQDAFAIVDIVTELKSTGYQLRTSDSVTVGEETFTLANIIAGGLEAVEALQNAIVQMADAEGITTYSALQLQHLKGNTLTLNIGGINVELSVAE